MVAIETELACHRASIRRITESAFAASEFGHNGEANLIDAVRGATDESLSLVAVSNEQVVGHALFSPVIIEPVTKQAGKQVLVGMGLGPISVLPALQGKGIGSRLITSGLQRLASMGTKFTVVAGHPDFYGLFGFLPAMDFGISHGFVGMPQEIFLVHTGDVQNLRNVGGGRAYYLPEFGTQHETTF